MLKAEQILDLNIGEMLDSLITSTMKKIDDEIEHKSWSTDVKAVFELRDFINALGMTVLSIKHAEAPIPIEEQCTLNYVDDEEEFSTTVGSSDFTRSMCLAFILIMNNHHGEFISKEFTDIMNNAPAKKRLAKVYQFPKRHTTGAES